MKETISPTDPYQYPIDSPYQYPIDRWVLSQLTLNAVQAEATRAHLRHGEHSMLGASAAESDRLAILTEEVGEVARELNEDRMNNIPAAEWRERRVKELIQVAAMALTWVEHLESAKPRQG